MPRPTFDQKQVVPTMAGGARVGHGRLRGRLQQLAASDDGYASERHDSDECVRCHLACGLLALGENGS